MTKLQSLREQILAIRPELKDEVEQCGRSAKKLEDTFKFYNWLYNNPQFPTADRILARIAEKEHSGKR